MYNILAVVMMALQVFILIRGFIRIRRYIFDICGYLNILFAVFFTLPAWDLFYGGGYFVHKVADFSVNPTQSDVMKYIVISTTIALLFDFGYFLGNRTFAYKVGDSRLLNIKAETTYNKNSYDLICFLLFSFWLYIMYSAYRTFGRSLLLFIMPSRKKEIYSGFSSMMQLVIPEVLLALSFVRHWDKRKIIIPSIFPLLMLLISVSSSDQRREMIHGIIFCGLLILIKYFNILGDKEGVERVLKKRPWRKYAITGIAISVALIPLLWYARNYSNQLTRGEVTVNPFSLHSFTDLIFGSSSTGFDTSLVVDWYDNTYGGLFFHCIRYFTTFWIPRAIFDGKTIQITLLIKLARGDWGNLSLFYINDLYFSFKYLSVIFVPLMGYLLSKIYNRASSSRDIKNVIFSIYIFSQVVLLFKNGVSVFFIRITLFYMIFSLANYFGQHVKVTH